MFLVYLGVFLSLVLSLEVILAWCSPLKVPKSRRGIQDKKSIKRN